MKQIPSNIKVHYDAHLKNKAISRSAHFQYLKWLRYYLDFCEKYHLNELKKENLIHFIAKLKDKKQDAQQQKQAHHAISLFYELAGSFSSEKVASLNTKEDKIATKKDALKLTNSSWVPVYDELISEIKLSYRVKSPISSWLSFFRLKELIGDLTP